MSLQGLDSMQKNLNIDDLQNLNSGSNMFEMLNKLKSYEKVIRTADIAVKEFWEKHFTLITATSYSNILYDIYKGIEALNNLIQFVIQNINGVKVKDIFSDYSVISSYFQEQYQITVEDADQIGESFMLTNPQRLFDIYASSKDIYCSPQALKKYIKEENSAYIVVNDEGIENFWEITSNFLCKSNSAVFSELSAQLANSFALPQGVKDIFQNEESIFQNLNANSSIFTNLNISTFQVQDADTKNKLDKMFNLFAGINSEYSGYCK